MPPLGQGNNMDDTTGGGSKNSNNNKANSSTNHTNESNNKQNDLSSLVVDSTVTTNSTTHAGDVGATGTSTNSTTGGGGGTIGNNNSALLLCASCDRCRARKTKCDGKRPCSNCIAKYVKRHKPSRVETVPVENFECIYSLAKRRGPVPGKSTISTQGGNTTMASAFCGSVNLNAPRRSNSFDMVDESSDGEQQHHHQHQHQPSPSPDNHNNSLRSHLGMTISPTKNATLAFPRGSLPSGTMGLMGLGGANGGIGGGAVGNAGVGVGGTGLGMGIDGSDMLTDAQIRAALMQQTYQQYHQLQNQQQQDCVYDKTTTASASIQHQLSILQQMQQQQQQQQQEKRTSLNSLNNDSSSTSNLYANVDTELANRRRKSESDGGATTATGFSSPVTMATRLQHQQQTDSDAVGGRFGGIVTGTTSANTRVSAAAAAAAALLGRNCTGAGTIGGAGVGGVGNFGIVATGVPRTVRMHTHLLDRNDVDGERLRSYYKLSIDEIFCLPVSPTEEEYCSRSNIVGLTPTMIPETHLAALSAVRFAEAALGAIANNEIPLGLELCNAVVHCLRESVQDPIPTPVMLEVAKTYFLLSVFRAFRGDMTRYFKYRRVSLNYIAKLGDKDDSYVLLAAMSYMDSWAYMIYNADESSVPDIDDTRPLPQQFPEPIPGARDRRVGSTGMDLSILEIERKYNVRTDIQSIVCHPRNKTWIQGAPPIYLNPAAPARARVLDALACVQRICCDQANGRFSDICIAAAAATTSSTESVTGTESVTNSNQKDVESSTPMVIDVDDQQQQQTKSKIPESAIKTPTSIAVAAHEQELCSRNLVLSAYALLQQEDIISRGHFRHVGQHMIISSMDAFLENSYDGVSSGFSESQVQSLLAVCNTIIENPLLLHHAGPTYHIVTNTTVLLGHFLNGMNAMKESQLFGAMETVMFDEILDTYVAVRKLLTVHRRKLPVKLRCHSIPRPSINTKQADETLINFGQTLLCSCRGCQGFVLVACSPCVAAERAQTAASRIEVAAAQEIEAVEMMDVLGGGSTTTRTTSGFADNPKTTIDYNNDDDALLGMISTLVTN